MSAQPKPVEPVWTFGDRMRKARTLAGMDQRQFATALGVTASALAAWETDRGHPRDIVAIAKRIEILTGIRAAWMLDVDSNQTSVLFDDGGRLPREDSNLQPFDYGLAG